MTSDHLRIDSSQGQTLMEYRIHNGHIEVRVPAPGDGEAPAEAAWRRLSAREFSAHLALNSALANWLRARAQRPQAGPSPSEEDSSAA